MVSINAESLISAADLARLLQLSHNRIRELHAEGHIEQVAHGVYALQRSVVGYQKFLKDGGKPVTEQERLTRAKADLAELELSENTGKLIPVDVVEREWLDLISRFRQRMLAIPARAAPLLVAVANQRAVFVLLTDLMHEALAELAGRYASSEPGQESAGPDATPAEADSQPMGGPQPAAVE